MDRLVSEQAQLVQLLVKVYYFSCQVKEALLKCGRPAT